MRVLLISIALLALTGCGFKPMYAPSSNAGGAVIGAVTVPEVPGKSGHAFRTELTRLLDAEGRNGGEPRRLDITMSEKVNALGLRVDESATRADMIVAATYTFYDLNGSKLVEGLVTATASYDIPLAAYAAAAAQDDARERAGVLLAQNLRIDLAIRLQRARREPAPPALQPLPKS